MIHLLSSGWLSQQANGRGAGRLLGDSDAAGHARIEAAEWPGTELTIEAEGYLPRAWDLEEWENHFDVVLLESAT